MSEKDVFDSYEWNVKDIKVYVTLDKQNNKYTNIKSGVLLLLFLVILLVDFLPRYTTQQSYEYTSALIIIYIFISYILIHTFSWLLHKVIWKRIIETYSPKKKTIEKNGEKYLSKHKKKDLVDYISCIASPDYYWAEYYKRKIGLSISKGMLLDIQKVQVIRYLKKFYIERSNWANLIATSFVAFVIISCLFYDILSPNWNLLILIFISLKLLSRTYEIIIAFYNDVVAKRDKVFYRASTYLTINTDVKSKMLKRYGIELRERIGKAEAVYIYPWKNSLLLPSARTSLALHSLLELAILFGCFYLLIDIINPELIPHLYNAEAAIEGDKIEIIKYFVYSFSIAITLPDLQPYSFLVIPQALQILSSLILIVMSISYYMGNDHKIQDSEKKLYLSVKSGKNF